MVFDPNIVSDGYQSMTNGTYTSMDLFLENDDNVVNTVKKVYIQNVISNYQEIGDHLNFCISFEKTYNENSSSNHFANINHYINHPDVTVSYGESGTIPLEDVFTQTDFNIPYPNYYNIQPGNDIIDYPNSSNGFILNHHDCWKFPYEFKLDPGEMFPFTIRFTPVPRRIDFYRANLVVHYTRDVSSFVYEKIHKIEADLISDVNSIDGKSFSSIVKVNGILSQNILLAQ